MQDVTVSQVDDYKPNGSLTKFKSNYRQLLPIFSMKNIHSIFSRISVTSRSRFPILAIACVNYLMKYMTALNIK